MVHTIRPERRESERRGGDRRVAPAETGDIDGVLYRLGRLQRVLIDVRAQVRDLRSYATVTQSDGRPVERDVVDNVTRRLERVEEALDAMRDDFDLARDAVESALEDEDVADVISIGDRSRRTGG